MDDKIMMTKKFTSSALKNQSGFGILEVMIAIVVLSIALLSLAGLHTLIIKSSGLAKSRAIAMSIAQEKLDDLRSFENLAGETGATSKLFGYDEIVTNLGGNETSAANDTPVLANSAVTVGNVTYNRAWNVECFSYAAENAAATSGTCTTGATRPAFKRVTATITWTDPAEPSVTQSVSLQAIISAVTPASSGLAGINGADFAAPVVRYTPGAAPDIIKIDTGNGSYKEATKPQPDLSNQGTNTLTSFDEVTYNNVNQSTADTLVRDSFFTVNCLCEFAGAGVGYKPTVYDAAENKYIVGDQVTKEVTGVPSGNGQPDACTICCRDHHDDTAPTSGTHASFDEVYDPFRSTADYTVGGNHKHYFDTSNNNTTLEAKAETSSQKYYEACKIVRVDGFLYVAQDWRMESMQVIPGLELDQDTEIAEYTTYVTDFVEDYILGIGSAYPQTTPVPTTSTTAFDFTSISPYSMISGADQSFVARSIFMDYISPALLNILKCKINQSGTDCTDIPQDSNYLAYVPFHEVNVTRLATWTTVSNTPTDGTGSTIDTANGNGFSDAITQQTDTSYIRGRVHMLEDGHAQVRATIKRSNTGLLPPQPPIDDLAIIAPDSLTMSDDVFINAPNAPVKFKITGAITATPNSVKINGPEQLSVVGSNGATCNNPVAGNGNTATYSCTLDSTIGTITFGNFTGSVTTCTGTGQNKVCTTAVNYDNCLDPSNNATPATAGGADGTSTETASYTFNGIAADTSFGVSVEHEPNAQCNP
jgi:Tfp pilus assembly protein PilV